MKALIVAATGFQDEEYIFPYYRMLEEGWKVDVGTPGGQDVYGKYGVPARATLSLKGYMPQAWDLPWDVLVIPGGFESPDRLRVIQEVKSIVIGMNRLGRTIGAICHGPWVCISAGILKGRKVTGYESIKDDLVNAGAEYLDQSCVVENNLVTAQHYRDNGPFMRAVIKTAYEREWGVEVCASVI
jgi:protease I